MGTEEVLKKIRSRDGVLDAFVIDEDVLSMIEGEESNIRTSGGLVYENLGIDRSKEMDTHVCVFSKGFITDPKGPMVVMTDDTGAIYGHDVPRKCKLSSSAVRQIMKIC